MLRSLLTLTGYEVRCPEGPLGLLKDVLFDDVLWGVRYLEVEPKEGFEERRVLVYPHTVRIPDGGVMTLATSMERRDLESGPVLRLGETISREMEANLHEHFGWEPYWKYEDPRLRSLRDVMGYTIAANDGDMGCLDDLLGDTDSWRVLYSVVDTGTWLPGRKVLVSVEWLEGISWLDRAVRVDLNRGAIRDSPPYDPDAPVDRDYETALFEHYGLPRYWDKD